MSNPADPSRPAPDAGSPLPSDARRLYEAPAILEDLPLETYSLACSKADVTCDPSGTTVQS